MSLARPANFGRSGTISLGEKAGLASRLSRGVVLPDPIENDTEPPIGKDAGYLIVRGPGVAPLAQTRVTQ